MRSALLRSFLISALGALIPRRFRRRARVLPYIALYAFFRTLFRVRPRRVTFLSDSRETISGNFLFVSEALSERHPEIEQRSSLKANLRGRRTLGEKFRVPYLIATSRIVLLDDYYPLIYGLPIRKKTEVVQLWHAAGAFKRVGFSRLGKPGGPSPKSRVHRNYSWSIVSSEQIRGDYAEAFHMPREKVLPLGMPRTDAFFDTENVASEAALVRRELGFGQDEKIVLYVPTFRGRGQLSAYFDLDSIDWAGLVAGLPENSRLLVKMHPFVPPLPDGFAEEHGFVDVSASREVTQLLFAADVVITDYSSVIFEYALLRRPMVFYVPDYDDYVNSRDFYYPFEDYLVGPVTSTTTELAAAVNSALSSPNPDVSSFVDFFCGACTGQSSANIADWIATRTEAGRVR